jgi:hypothetical protein
LKQKRKAWLQPLPIWSTIYVCTPYEATDNKELRTIYTWNSVKIDCTKTFEFCFDIDICALNQKNWTILLMLETPSPFAYWGRVGFYLDYKESLHIIYVPPLCHLDN